MLNKEKVLVWISSHLEGMIRGPPRAFSQVHLLCSFISFCVWAEKKGICGIWGLWSFKEMVPGKGGASPWSNYDAQQSTFTVEEKQQQFRELWQAGGWYESRTSVIPRERGRKQRHFCRSEFRKPKSNEMTIGRSERISPTRYHRGALPAPSGMSLFMTSKYTEPVKCLNAGGTFAFICLVCVVHAPSSGNRANCPSSMQPAFLLSVWPYWWMWDLAWPIQVSKCWQRDWSRDEHTAKSGQLHKGAGGRNWPAAWMGP